MSISLGFVDFIIIFGIFLLVLLLFDLFNQFLFFLLLLLFFSYSISLGSLIFFFWKSCTTISIQAWASSSLYCVLTQVQETRDCLVCTDTTTIIELTIVSLPCFCNPHILIILKSIIYRTFPIGVSCVWMLPFSWHAIYR